MIFAAKILSVSFIKTIYAEVIIKYQASSRPGAVGFFKHDKDTTLKKPHTLFISI